MEAMWSRRKSLMMSRELSPQQMLAAVGRLSALVSCVQTDKSSGPAELHATICVGMGVDYNILDSEVLGQRFCLTRLHLVVLSTLQL